MRLRVYVCVYIGRKGRGGNDERGRPRDGTWVGGETLAGMGGQALGLQGF